MSPKDLKFVKLIYLVKKSEFNFYACRNSIKIKKILLRYFQVYSFTRILLNVLSVDGVGKYALMTFAYLILYSLAINH